MVAPSCASARICDGRTAIPCGKPSLKRSGTGSGANMPLTSAGRSAAPSTPGVAGVVHVLAHDREGAPVGVLAQLPELGLGVLAAVDRRHPRVDGGALHAPDMARSPERSADTAGEITTRRQTQFIDRNMVEKDRTLILFLSRLALIPTARIADASSRSEPRGARRG